MSDEEKNLTPAESEAERAADGEPAPERSSAPENAAAPEHAADGPVPISEEWPPAPEASAPRYRSVAEQLAEAGLPQPSVRQTDASVPGEVVECYEPTFGREVVETYTQPRPLPGRRPAPPQPKRHRRRRIWVILACVAAAVGLAAGAWFLGRSDAAAPPDSSGEYESYNADAVSIPVTPADPDVQMTVAEERGTELSAQEVYARVNPSVVTVLVQLGEDGASVGTGVIFTADGYILTNYHVVAGGIDCSVTLSNDVTYTAGYVAGDVDNDLAVLKVEAVNLPAAEIGSSDGLQVGDKVYAIGNPLGVELRGTFTDGIVSAINRNVEVEGRTMTLVQTNAALNSGNSGGPLINSAGQVVGINTIKMSSAFSNIEGLGFAIPSSSMQYIVNDLLTYGAVQPEPVLGISVARVGSALPDGTVGIRVEEVVAGSAAGKAGVRVGDTVVSADGETVTSSADLLRIRRRFNVGDELTVRVYRAGQYLNLTLELQQAAE